VTAVDVAALERGVLAQDRAAIARAITLVESTAHQAHAIELLRRLHPRTGRARRIGITGVPGAGKSTLLEALGMHTLARASEPRISVAVLAVDPSSQKSGGSILGDKTRMARLSRDPRAFVRPSPSGGVLGGVARSSRDAIRVLDAAGVDVIFVETVGVGQSETVVASLVDTVVWVVIPNAGDELQGIKRGIAELAEVIVVNKCDGDRVEAAERARVELTAAMRHFPPMDAGWRPTVLTTSALPGASESGLSALEAAIEAHRVCLETAGELTRRRASQEVAAMWRIVEESAWARLRQKAGVAAIGAALEERVRRGELAASVAASEVLDRAR
jgi:LAO/AO transport system kinase